MPIQLINNSTGQLQDIRDEEVNYAITSGKFSFHPDTTEVPIMRPDTGEVVTMPVEGVSEAFKGGWNLANPQTISNADDVNRQQTWHKDLDNPWSVGAAGALSSYTLGGSDLAVRGAEALGALPKGSTNFLQQEIQENPEAYLAGNVAGALIPGGALGLVSKGGKAIAGATVGRLSEGIIQRAAAKTTAEALEAATEAGGGFEGMATLGDVASATQKATSTLANNIVLKAANRAVGSAIEGAAIGGQQFITEASLGDPNEAAEHFVANLGMGALVGGAIGLAAPLAGAALKEGRDLVGRGVSSVTSRGYGSFKNVIRGMQGEGGALATDVENAGELGKRALSSGSTEVNEATRAADAEISAVQKEQKQINRTVATSLREAAGESVSTAQEANNLSLEGMSRAADQTEEGVKKAQNELNTAIGTLTESSIGISKKAAEIFDSKIEEMSKGTKIQRDYAKDLKVIRDNNLGELAAQTDVTNTLGADVRKAVDARQALNDLKQNPAYSNALKNDAGLMAKDINYLLKGGTRVVGGVSTEIAPMSERAAEVISKPDAQYHAWREARDTLNRTLWNKADKEPDLIKALKAIKDPYKENAIISKLVELSKHVPSEQANKILDNISSYTQSRSDLLAAKASQENANNLASRIINKTASPEDASKMMREMGASEEKIAAMDTGRKAQILRSVQEKLGPNASPLDVVINFAREAGMPVNKQYAAAAELAPIMAKVEKLRAISAQNSGSAIGTAATMGGAAIGGMLGHGIGGAVGAMAGKSVATGLASFVDPLASIRTFQTIERSGKSFSRLISSASDKLVNGLTGELPQRAASVITTKESIKSRREEFKKQQSDLNNSTNNINQLKHNAQVAFGQYAPQLASAVIQKIDVAHQYLQSKAPVDPLAGKSIMSNKTGWVPSDSDLASWSRTLSAVNDPTSVIDSMSKGLVTKEGIDALKNVYPTIFKDLQSKVLSAIMIKQPDLNYGQKLALSTLFDIPSDPSLTSDFFGTMQANYAQKNNGDQGGRPPKATTDSKKLAEAASPMTDNQRVEHKNV